MVGIGIDTGKSLQATLGVAQAEAPTFEKVTWYSNSGLRKLYFWAAILCVASATTGYDGYGLLTPKLSRKSKANLFPSGQNDAQYLSKSR